MGSGDGAAADGGRGGKVSEGCMGAHESWEKAQEGFWEKS